MPRHSYEKAPATFTAWIVRYRDDKGYMYNHTQHADGLVYTICPTRADARQIARHSRVEILRVRITTEINPPADYLFCAECGRMVAFREGVHPTNKE